MQHVLTLNEKILCQYKTNINPFYFQFYCTLFIKKKKKKEDVNLILIKDLFATST